MQVCNACRVAVAPRGGNGFCPLCGTQLAPGPAPGTPGEGAPASPGNGYPDLAGRTAQYNFILRLLVFLSVLGGGISVLINLLAYSDIWWSLIVVAALVYLWLTVPPLLRRGVNYAKRTVFQVLFTAALAVVLDLLTGYRGWSVSYVIPGLLCSGTLAIGLLIAFNRTNWAQYVLYQVLIGVFAFIPLVLYLTGLADNLVMVLLSAGLGLASLLVTIVFGDRTIKSEFKRRFHF